MREPLGTPPVIASPCHPTSEASPRSSARSPRICFWSKRRKSRCRTEELSRNLAEGSTCTAWGHGGAGGAQYGGATKGMSCDRVGLVQRRFTAMIGYDFRSWGIGKNGRCFKANSFSVNLGKKGILFGDILHHRRSNNCQDCVNYMYI